MSGITIRDERIFEFIDFTYTQYTFTSKLRKHGRTRCILRYKCFALVFDEDWQDDTLVYPLDGQGYLGLSENGIGSPYKALNSQLETIAREMARDGFDVDFD